MYKILIAEDELPERRGLRALLERYYGDRVQICGEAGTGREALKFFRELSPDMVMMDINMPEMDGLEAADKVKADNPDLPIVIITAYSLFEYARKAIRIGVADYIVKPYSIKTLRQTMDRILDREDMRRESLASLQSRYGTGAAEKRADESNLFRKDSSGGELSGKASPRERALCESVQAYIESRYQKEISLNELSEHVGLSKYHLSRIFADAVGMGIKEYHISIRIREAKYYLSLGYTVAEAAYAVGFKDPNYFSRVVKKYTGKTARELAEEQ